LVSYVYGCGLGSAFFGVSKSEVKRRPLIQFGGSPDCATMFLDDSLHGREAHPRAFEIFWSVQSLKDAKQFVSVFHAESHPVVADIKNRPALLHFLPNLDDGLRMRPSELDRIRKQVLEDLFH
jgi:hypothetical protein